MRKIIFGLAVLLGMGHAAYADTTVLSTFGYWQVFGGIADNGSPVCGLRTGWAGGTQGFIVKWFSGLELIVHIYKSTWNVPEGRQVDLQFQFDHAAERERDNRWKGSHAF